MRFRDERPGDLAKARRLVADWRAEHPDGTPAQLVDAVGRHFHPDWRVVLHALLYVADKHRSREITGVITRHTGGER